MKPRDTTATIFWAISLIKGYQPLLKSATLITLAHLTKFLHLPDYLHQHINQVRWITLILIWKNVVQNTCDMLSSMRQNLYAIGITPSQNILQRNERKESITMLLYPTPIKKVLVFPLRQLSPPEKCYSIYIQKTSLCVVSSSAFVFTQLLSIRRYTFSDQSHISLQSFATNMILSLRFSGM